MKKILSLLCVLAVTVGIIAVGVVSVSADVPATVANVKTGDKVKYVLELGGIENPVIAFDFSVYYDSSVLQVESVSDYTNSTNPEDLQYVVNTDLNNEVRGNFANATRGINFDKQRNFLTVNFTAKKDGETHISYFIRDMIDSTYDKDNTDQISIYQFTCTLTVNDQEVVSDAMPELDVEARGERGGFVNSRSGLSADADAALSGDSIKTNKGASDDISKYENENNVNRSAENYISENGYSIDINGGNSGGGNNPGSDADDGTVSVKASEKAGDKNATQADKKASEAVKQNASENEKTDDAEGKSGEKSEAKAANAAKNEGGSSATMWIIIAAVIVIAGGCIGYVVVRNKKGGSAKSADSSDKQENEDKN